VIRRVVAFDLDNTLADSKSPITGEMAGLLDRLLARFQVCVISGGKFEQFETQLIDHLDAAPDKLASLRALAARNRAPIEQLRLRPLQAASPPLRKPR
jgi:FMN phosphatase YigB (HAD superfamily)